MATRKSKSNEFEELLFSFIIMPERKKSFDTKTLNNFNMLFRNIMGNPRFDIKPHFRMIEKAMEDDPYTDGIHLGNWTKSKIYVWKAANPRKKLVPILKKDE